MSLPIVRPQVDQLQFRLYDRALHPELFEIQAQRQVTHNGQRLTVRMTSMGHVLEWTDTTTTLSEVIATNDQLLPTLGRQLAYRFQGESQGRWTHPEGIQYSVAMQLERMTPEVFAHEHDELLADGHKRGLLVHYRHKSRIGLNPLGFVSIEVLAMGLNITTFHTFPDEFAFVKTQSLIEG